MTRKAIRLFLAAAFVAAFLFVVAPSQPAHAAGVLCAAQPASHFEGVVQNQVTYDVGGQGTMNVRSPALCQTRQDHNNFSTIWVMTREVTQRSAYMQAGYFRYWGDCVRHYTEHDRDGFNAGFPFRRTLSPGCLADQEMHAYTTQYEAVCLCNRLKVDITVFDSTEYNIYQEWSNTSNDFLAEALDLTSDIPGTAAAQASEQGMLEQRPLTNAWQNQSFPLDNVEGDARWLHQQLAPTSWAYWTNPL